MNIQERMNEWAKVPVKVDDTERRHLCQIKQWVLQLCRKRELDPADVFVSAFPQPVDNGTVKTVTLICIVDNLPESPVVTIAKAPAEVSVEDVMGCYKLLNFCCG